MTTTYLQPTNPYYHAPIHGVYPTVTLPRNDVKGAIWHQFDRFGSYDVLSLASIVNDVARALVPVGYRDGLDLHGALAEMVDDGTLTLTRQGGYPAYRRNR